MLKSISFGDTLLSTKSHAQRCKNNTVCGTKRPSEPNSDMAEIFGVISLENLK